MKFFARHERTIFTLFGLAFLILIWWIVAVLLQQNGTTLFLTPGETVSRILQLCFGKEAGSTFSAIGWTLFRLVLGFVFSFFLAAILGTLAGLFPKLRHFLKPFVGLSRSIPTAAVVPSTAVSKNTACRSDPAGGVLLWRLFCFLLANNAYLRSESSGRPKKSE